MNATVRYFASSDVSKSEPTPYPVAFFGPSSEMAFEERTNPSYFIDDITATPTDYYDYSLLADYDYGQCKNDHHGAFFLPVLYSIFFLLGVLGNSLVIWVITCGLRLRSMTDVCLLNLAISDLLLVCSLPFLARQASDQWVFGDALCKTVLGIYHIVFYSGTFFLCLMSIDRYLAIVHAVYAITARTRTFGMMAAVVIWVAGFFASFPELIYLKMQQSGNRTLCFPAYPSTQGTNIHFWTIFGHFKRNILGLLVPSVIICFCYSKIICRLCHSQTSKIQVIRLVLLIVVVFFCCWVPYNFVTLFQALELLDVYTECESHKSIRLALEITEVFAYFHSCLNPVLYVLMGTKFRRSLARLVNRAPCKVCRSFRVLIPFNSFQLSVLSQNTSLSERSTAI